MILIFDKIKKILNAEDKNPKQQGYSRKKIRKIWTQLFKYMEKDQYQNAMEYSLKFDNITNQVHDKNNEDYVILLICLTDLNIQMGRFNEALSLLLESKELTPKVSGKESLNYTIVLNKFATYYYEMGQYDKSLPLQLESKEITYKILGKDNEHYCVVLVNLANIYRELGQHDKALNLLLKSKEITYKEFGENNEKYADTLNSLGIVYTKMEQVDKAHEAFLKSTKIRGRLFGKKHHIYAESLNNMAGLLRRTGKNYNYALPLYQESIEIMATAYGQDHFRYAQALNNLAAVYQNMNQPEKALPLLLQSKEIRKQTLGENHPHYANTLNNIAILCSEVGLPQKAFEMMKEVFLTEIKIIHTIFSISSEKQRNEFLKNIRFSLDDFLSLIAGPLKEDNEAKKFAFEVVLRWKGLETETSMAKHELILAGEYPELSEVFQILRQFRDQYVQLILAETNQNSREYKLKLKELKELIEQIESKLALEIPQIELKKRLSEVDQHIIANQIPNGAILVDFIRFDYSQPGEVPGPKYLAFILKSDDPKKVHMVNLEDADKIDSQIWELRSKITGEGIDRGINKKTDTSDPSPTSSNLANLIIEPIIKTVGNNYKTLLFSPDGDLSLLPFEIIPYGEGYFMDYYEINYLGSTRDILRFDQDIGRFSNPMIMVDPDFNYSKDNLKTKNSKDYRLNLSRDLHRDEINFVPLPGTKLEGERISQILKDSNPQILMNRNAVETRLKTSRSPWILHIATHGFFLPDLEPKKDDNDMNRGLRFSGPGMENPLIRSGLAFAGANTHPDNLPDDAEDGIFTAEEASGLNLLNTQLVVLSACETGLGEVRLGEGVFGLRRAFVLAGASTLIMSLWKVNDIATSIFMERFYQNLLFKKIGRNSALKEAKKYIRNLRVSDLRDSWLSEEFISNLPSDLQEYLNDLSTFPNDYKPFEHPYFWGAFICQGDPKPLQRIESI